MLTSELDSVPAQLQRTATGVLAKHAGLLSEPAALCMQGARMSEGGAGSIPVSPRMRLSSVDREAKGVAASGPLSEYPELASITGIRE